MRRNPLSCQSTASKTHGSSAPISSLFVFSNICRFSAARVKKKGDFSVAKRLLSVLLSAGIVWSGVPAVQADQSDAMVSYVENEGELFRLDFSDVANVQLENVSSGPASWQVTLDHAVFPGGISRQEYFVFNDPVETSRFIDLGVDPDTAARAMGEDISTVVWEQVVRLEVTSTLTHFILRYTTQADYLEISYPKSFLLTGHTVDPYDAVSIDVNGEVALISQQLFNKLGSGDPEKIEPMLNMFPASVTSAIATLVDPDGLMNAVLGFEHMALVTKRVSGDVVQGCWGVCMSCAGSVLAFGASLAGIIFACGSALVTGGSTAVLCILAFVGATGVAAVSLGACAACGSCGRGDDCPCSGQPVCDCA